METQSVKTFFELFIQLLETIIWPATLIFILLLFRKSFASIISRTNSLKADSSGIEMTFQEKIEKAKNLVNKPSTPVSKSGKEIITDKQPKVKVLKIRTEIDDKLKNWAKENNLPDDRLTSIEINDKLSEAGIITLNKARAIEALIDITNSVNQSVSENQASEIQNLWEQVQTKP